MSDSSLDTKAQIFGLENVEHNDTFYAKMIQIAVAGKDVIALDLLYKMHASFEENSARKQYYRAFSAFQSDMPMIKKLKTASFPTKNGGRMTYNYASIDDISEQIKPLLKKHGFSYRFERTDDEESRKINIRCIVTHSAGHSESCAMSGPPDMSGSKNPLQQASSTVTYLERYSLCGALGIATADADIDDRLPETEEDAGEIEFYSDDLFAANFRAWEKAIKSGKITKKGVMDKIQSKSTLADYQIVQIEAIEENGQSEE